jgi:hypothetical protein
VPASAASDVLTVHRDGGDAADVPGPATVLGQHQLRAGPVQRRAVDPDREQHGRAAEVGVDLGPGQQRVMPVGSRDGDQEPQAVLATGGVEAGPGVGQDVVQERALEAVVLYASWQSAKWRGGS